MNVATPGSVDPDVMTNRIRQIIAIACVAFGGLLATPAAEAQWAFHRPAARLQVEAPVRHSPHVQRFTSLRDRGVRSQTQLHPDPAPRQAGPGHLQCTVRSNNVPMNGLMEVRLEGRVIATGRCGAPLEVPAGRYDVTLTLLDAMDRPQRTVPVTVTEGGVARAETRFGVGTLAAAVLDGRTRVRGSTLVYKDGRYVGSLGSGGTAQLSADRYELVSRYGRQTHNHTVDVPAGQRVGAIARF